MHHFTRFSLVALAAGLVAAPAAQADFAATASDPAGDAADASPGRDITAIAFAYDRRGGRLFGAVQLRGTPQDGAGALISLFAGTRTATGCNGFPAVGFGSVTDETGARWLRIDDGSGNGPRGSASKSGSLSNVQQFEVTDPQLAGRRVDCVVATLTELGNAAVVYDQAGPVLLAGLPALTARIQGASHPFTAGRAYRVKLTLANPGDGPTRRVRLKAARARGLTVRLATRSLPPIAAGGKRTVSATVTLDRRARLRTDLTITATAGDVVTRAIETLYLNTPSRPGGGGRPDDSTQLCNRWQPDLSGQTGGSLILVPC